MLIGELVKQSNTTKDTIRHYDELGLLISSQRQAGSRLYKEYSAENLERIEMIRLAKFMGFTLGEISQQIEAYFAGDISSEDQIAMLKLRMKDVEEKIQNLETVKEFLTFKIQFVATGQEDHAQCIQKQNALTHENTVKAVIDSLKVSNT